MAGLATVVLRRRRRHRPRPARAARRRRRCSSSASSGSSCRLGYTAPPLKFVYRGLGEIAVAIGFGPLMLLGAYVVQTARRADVGAVRRVAADRAARRADPVRQRDPRPARRRPGREADAAGPLPAGDGHRRLPARGRGARTRSSSSASSPGSCRSRRCSRCSRSRWRSRSRAASSPNYDNPYGLMAIMGVNIKVHLYAGLLLLAAYLVVL